MQVDVRDNWKIWGSWCDVTHHLLVRNLYSPNKNGPLEKKSFDICKVGQQYLFLIQKIIEMCLYVAALRYLSHTVTTVQTKFTLTRRQISN